MYSDVSSPHAVAVNLIVHLPSVATWLSHRINRVEQKRFMDGSSLEEERVAAFGRRGCFLLAASKAVDARDALVACEDHETFSVHSASTNGGAGSRASRRAHLRKTAKNRVKCEAECLGNEQLLSTAVEANATSASSDVGTQCNLGRKDLQRLDIEWREKYEVLKKQLNTMRLRSLGARRIDEPDLGYDANGDDSSMDSWVCGFSDYGDGGGHGTKVVLSPLPNSWTKQQVEELLGRSGLPVPNFIGIIGEGAAVFCDHDEHAQQIVDTLNFTVLGNRVLRAKVEDDRQDETDDQSMDSEVGKSVEVGDTVLVKGLQSETGRAYNGLYGKVSSWDSKTGRYGISLAGKMVSVKPENLEIMFPESDLNQLLNLKCIDCGEIFEGTVACARTTCLCMNCMYQDYQDEM